jgi:hypothetical protein
LQNILLAEAKRKIADTSEESSSGQLTHSVGAEAMANCHLTEDRLHQRQAQTVLRPAAAAAAGGRSFCFFLKLLLRSAAAVAAKFLERGGGNARRSERTRRPPPV